MWWLKEWMFLVRMLLWSISKLTKQEILAILQMPEFQKAVSKEDIEKIKEIYIK